MNNQQLWLRRAFVVGRDWKLRASTAVTKNLVAEAGPGLVAKGLPRVYNGQNIRLGSHVTLDHHIELGATSSGRIFVADYALISQYTVVAASTEISIGRASWLGARCYLIDSNHGMAPGIPFCVQPSTAAPITIGDDVWVGTGSTILAGVTVGAGAVVGAGSVVTKDVPSGAVVGGTPARFIKWRTPPTDDELESPMSSEALSLR